MCENVMVSSYAAASRVKQGGKNEDRNSWKRCAWLAIAWNNIEFARENIFNTENRFHYQVGGAVFENTYFTFFSDFKKHDFTFFEVVYRKVVKSR